MFTALSISSMPSRMPMVLRRVTTPNSPIANSAAARRRYAWSPIGGGNLLVGVGAGEVYRAQQRGHEEHGQELEGHHPAREHGLADGPRDVAGHRGPEPRQGEPGD